MTATRSYRLRASEARAQKPTTREIAVTAARRLQPGAARAAGGLVEIAADEVVRVELDNGFVLWSRADDLIRERGRPVVSRDGGASWEIRIAPPPGAGAATSRGWLGLGVRLLEVFGIDLQGKAASALGSGFERRLLGNVPGLYHCPLDRGGADGPPLKPLADGAAIPADQGPLLVFIHGTASRCGGSFGKLWAGDNRAGAALRKRLHEHYGERAFAFEHRSLTESPIENALALAARLPDGAELDLVSHSRGGLIGELICLGARERRSDPLRDDLIAALFAADRTVAEQLGLSPLDARAAAARDAAYAADRAALARLRDLLDQKQLRVRRFVRAACPARGTTLASGRLDRWLSVVDFLSGEGLFGDVVDFLLAVVKERTDPRTLPGLEAMMPGSALTRLLAHPDLVVDADLSVIAGDIEGDSLWGQLKLLAADWFYGADHDLVVNTGSMYGGLRRPVGGARFLRDQGPDVNHFHYFRNERSVKWLENGLTRADGSDGGFTPITEARHEAPRWREAVRRSRAAAAPRPLAVVLPGTMGSALQVDGERVWLHYWRLLRGGLSRLEVDAAGVEPVELIDDFYGPLLEFLARSHRVEIFPYDWRMSVRDAAAELAARLEGWLADAERAAQPVHLVAHSMGGLVVRTMIADNGPGAALWRRICALPNSRLLMLGTPNRGSHEAVRWLTACNPTLLKLALLDFTQSANGIVEIVREYPGLAELLPFAPDGHDFADPMLWKRLRQELNATWKPADAAVLRGARETWKRLLNAPPDPEHMVYVAGCQRETVADYRVEPDESWIGVGRSRLAFDATADGDGTVTWASGRLPGVRTWYVNDTAHDALCAQRRAFPGYLDLLMTGATARLPESPPARARAGEVVPERFPLTPRPFADSIPDQHEIERLGFGGGLAVERAEQERALPLLRVRVRHGDLAYARHPVLVGHYAGDTIVSAEAAVDWRLGQALSRRLQLGLYPAELRSHALFFNERPEGRPGGAVVVGLGQVGELSPGLLEAGIKGAVLDYALQVAQWPDDRFGPTGRPRSAALSCLLVGSGAGGMTVSASVEAVLRGALAASNRLLEQGLDNRVVIDELEFIEVFEDRAIQAGEALAELLIDGELAATVEWRSREIEAGPGRRRRVRFDEEPEWWQRLEIYEEQRGGALRFVFATDRARAEETRSFGQLQLAESFIRQASSSPAANTEVARTLFEMLLPNRLKEMAPRQSNLVLLVDERSARYPWELLENRWSVSGRPPAVGGGLVRQLRTREFRATPAHSTVAKAFVVGNPDLAGRGGFVDLPGARDEANAVAAVLRDGGFEVLDSIDERADQILAGLHRDSWRILHLAGHGEHELEVGIGPDGQPLKLSGMIIGRDGLLTPGDVEQMRWVPELVFINCCHLGKTETAGRDDYSPLAANLAVQFIRMGVKGVVAAGWAVDDAAANAFAASFYRHLLDGRPFGEAVRAAREQIWTHFPGVNTWGAYQCYGDPSYRLRGDGSAAPRQEPPPHRTPSELVAAVENQIEWVRVQSREQGEEVISAMRERIASELSRIPGELRERWLARADVAAAVGLAWGEIKAYTEAIEWLEQALLASDGDCPLRAVEQCANFRVRLAGEEWNRLRDTTVDRAQRAALERRIMAAIEELALVCERAPNVERLSLLGSACKRLAWLRDEDEPRHEALVNMAHYYREAYRRSRAAGGCDPYPFTNWATARVLQALFEPEADDDWKRRLGDECLEVIALAREQHAERPSFWLQIAEPDCELVRWLAELPKPASAARIAALYREALTRGASPRERASLLEHLDFVIAVSDHASAARRRGLKQIRSEL